MITPDSYLTPSLGWYRRYLRCRHLSCQILSSSARQWMGDMYMEYLRTYEVLFSKKELAPSGPQEVVPKWFQTGHQEPGAGNRATFDVRTFRLVILFPQPSNQISRRLLCWSQATKFRATEGSVALENIERLNRATENFRNNLRVAHHNGLTEDRPAQAGA